MRGECVQQRAIAADEANVARLVGEFEKRIDEARVDGEGSRREATFAPQRLERLDANAAAIDRLGRGGRSFDNLGDRRSDNSRRAGSDRSTTSSAESVPSASICAMRVSMWRRRCCSWASVCSTSLRRNSSIARR